MQSAFPSRLSSGSVTRRISIERLSGGPRLPTGKHNGHDALAAERRNSDPTAFNHCIAMNERQESKFKANLGLRLIYAESVSVSCNKCKFNEKALRETQTLRALAVYISKVRTPPARPPVTHPQTGPITIHCAAAS